MLKLGILLFACTGTAVFVSGTPSATWDRPQSKAAIPPVIRNALGAGVHAKAVRAEYAEQQGNYTPSINTELVITNTSPTNWIQLKDLVVLGRDGLQTILSVHRGLSGTSVPPLGQVLVPVDPSIGASPRKRSTARSARDVSTIVVLWEGPANGMRLTSTIRDFAPGNGWGYMGTTVEEGFDLTF